VPVLDLVARPEAVPRTRGLVREVLDGWGEAALRDDVDLVLSELLANAVLHAPGPARVVVERDTAGVRLEVRDTSPVPPLRRISGRSATTGRGLNLVNALCSSWGVSERGDGEPGKSVWCVVGGVEQELPDVDLDVDALLAAFDDDEDDEPTAAEVRLGAAPVLLLLEAKDQLDGVLRELALAEAAGDLPQDVVEAVSAATRRFAPARIQLRALLTGAVAGGQDRVELVFRLPTGLAEAGEAYLQALRTADTFARDRRMLSLESPIEHRVLREWYVEGLVAGLRAVAQGGTPARWEGFEQRLLRELHVLDERHRQAQLGAQLQRVTALLAAAETVQQIADTAVNEGVLALGASGGTLNRVEDSTTVPVTEAGEDAGLAARYHAVPAQDRHVGPSTQALRTRQPVWVEGREEVDSRFPLLRALQPGVVSVAALPLLVAGSALGVLRLSWSAPHAFSDTERDFLDGLAVQTAQAVARADALQRLRDLRDELDRLVRSTGEIRSTDLGVLRSLYADAPVGIAVFDADRRYLRVNEVVAAANGVPAADHVGRTVAGVSPHARAEDLARFDALLDRVLVGAEPLEEELDLRRHGGPVWRTSWFPVVDARDRVEAAVVLTVDITGQRRAEQRTRALALLGDRLGSDRTPEAVLEAVVDAVVPELADWAVVHLRDARGRVTCPVVRHPDPQREDLLRRTLGRFPVRAGQPFGAGRVLQTGRTERLPPVDDALVARLGVQDTAMAAAVLEVGAGAGAVVPLVAGGLVLGALSVSRQRAEGLSVEDLAVVEDVGRRAGVALEGVRARATTTRLEIALDAAGVGSFDWDVRSGALAWDERMYRLFDLDPSTELTLEGYLARLHPDDVERVLAVLEQTVADVGELELLYRVRTPDASERWLEARGRALPGPDGTAQRVVGTAVDVTDRQEGSARAERTLELMADAFFSLDRSWRFTYVNREAERLLGQPREVLLGRDYWECFPGAVGGPFEERYRRAVRTGEPARFEEWSAPLERLFEVRAHPAREGLSVYFSDVTGRRETARQRDRALERLSLLNEVGAALTATLDVDEGLSRLAGLLVPALADLVTVDLSDDGDVRGARSVVTVASDPRKAEGMLRAEQLLARRHNPGSAVHQVLHGAALVHVEVTPEHLARVVADPEQRAVYEQLQVRQVVVVPLVARGRVFGALSLIRTGDEVDPFTADDLALAQDVGQRAGLMVDNAAQYTAQRMVAEGLQRSLLPELPQVAGLAIGAAYEPSSSAALVGGDWYDAFVLPGGGVGLVIGDVMGHDLAAAAAMGQLRSVLRTCAAYGDPPALVLDRLDHLVTSFAMADLATVVYAQVDRHADGSAVLSWANAGHPPPLLLRPDGSCAWLDDGSSIMIGAAVGQVRESAEQALEPGSTVLMFTDGLVERRGRDLDAQLEDLAATVARLAGEVDGPGDLCRRLLASVRRDADTDDAAAIAVTLV